VSSAQPLPDPRELLRQSVRSRGLLLPVASSGEAFLEWSKRVAEPKGPLDFERFPFQLELYRVVGDEKIREVVIMKGTQVGVSALLNRFTLYLAARGYTAIYVFPTRGHVLDFSDSRVMPLLSKTPLAELAAALSVRNKGMKSVGDGLVFYRGSESKSGLVGVDADLVVLDEYDQLSARNVPEAERRVSGSKLGLIRRVGVPSHPDSGIALLYDESDRRQWFVRCEACTRWQPVEFATNLHWDEDADANIRNARVVCVFCSKNLDVTKGEWVAEFPGRDTPGFHVHRLLVPGTDLAAIIKASKRREPHEIEAFHNSDLGRPFTSETDGLDRSVIAAAQSASTEVLGAPYEMPRGYHEHNLVTMGVDVASVRNLHVRISEHLEDPLEVSGHRKRALFIGEVETFEELAELIDRYSVDCACVDHLPERRMADGLADAFPGRVFVVNYMTNGRDPIRFNFEDRQVSVDRDAAMGGTVDIFRAGRNLLPATLPEGYVAHLVRSRRQVDRDVYGRKRVQWVTPRDTDYFHAEVYDVVATELAKSLAIAQELAPRLVQIRDFEPSRLDDPSDMYYSPGPPEPEFNETWYDE
jgi:hypothetical protein